MNRIRFFNYFHNGDIHVSRELVKIIMNKVKQIDHNAEFSYAHVNDPCLLSDIDGLEYVNLNSLKHLSIDQFDNLIERDSITYINTWFAQQNFKYMNVYGISLDCLYAALNDTCKNLWQFSIEDVCPNPNSYIPTIDYSKFEIIEAEKWLDQHPQKKVFVANGHANSGQASNFNMTPIIKDLAEEYKDTIFILSSQEDESSLPENVVYSRDIIKKPNGSDLNENSFLTNYCYLIIGRASGVYSYAWTQANVLERQAKFLAFCSPGILTQKGYPFWTHDLFHDRINYTAQFSESPTGDVQEVKNIIRSYLI